MGLSQSDGYTSLRHCRVNHNSPGINCRHFFTVAREEDNRAIFKTALYNNDFNVLSTDHGVAVGESVTKTVEICPSAEVVEAGCACAVNEAAALEALSATAKSEDTRA